MKKSLKVGDTVTINTGTAPTKTGTYLLTTKIKKIQSSTFITEESEPYFGYNTFKITDIVQQAFLISPVKDITKEDENFINNYINNSNYKIHFPLKNTVQTTTELNICKQNKNAIKNSDVVLIFYKEGSKGSLFDLGMAFAMGKKIVCINEIESTEYKSFANLIKSL